MVTASSARLLPLPLSALDCGGCAALRAAESVFRFWYWFFHVLAQHSHFTEENGMAREEGYPKHQSLS